MFNPVSAELESCQIWSVILQRIAYRRKLLKGVAMTFDEFLVKRRQLMANKMRRYYSSL